MAGAEPCGGLPREDSLLGHERPLAVAAGAHVRHWLDGGRREARATLLLSQNFIKRTMC